MGVSDSPGAVAVRVLKSGAARHIVINIAKSERLAITVKELESLCPAKLRALNHLRANTFRIDVQGTECLLKLGDAPRESPDAILKPLSFNQGAGEMPPQLSCF
jgi:hypothetical protein